IWELLEWPRRSDDIISTLGAEFDVDRATLERDTLAFLERLCTEGLVQVVATDT
ncbi:MAG: PqqD family protein, partial [Acidobacteria bacterium]|nr:PqqD family protein [Acidobacteriota bacterium]